MKKIYLLHMIVMGIFLLTAMQSFSQVALMAVDDGTAFKEKPDSTALWKNAKNIFVYKTDTTEAIAFVKFNISKFEGKQVSDAVFSTRSDMNDGKFMTVKLTKSASTDFSRSTLTWNNKPKTSDELATVIYDQESGRKEFAPNGTRLKDYINEALAMGKEYIAFGINFKSGDGGEFKWAGGVGDGTWGPMLELTFKEGFNYYSIDDGTAFKENPDTTANWKNADNIFVYKTDTTEAIAFVKFRLPGFAYKTVESAEFSSRSDMVDGKTMTVALVSSNTTNFTRDSLTWSNKPATGNELATVLMDQESNRKTYTQIGTKLVDFINEQLALGKEEIAFALKYKSGDGGDFKWAGGTGNGAWGPMLEVKEGMASHGYAVADGVATQNHPDSTANAFAATNIFVSKSSDTTEQIAFIKFDISAFAGRTAEDIKFSTRSDMNNGTTMTVSLRKVNATDFQRSTLTWNNKPAVGDEVATVIMDQESNRKYYTSTGTALVDYVNSKLAEGADFIAFALKYKEGDGGDFKWAGGKGDANYGPLLEIEFNFGFNSYAIDDGTGFKEKQDTTANWKNADNIYIYKTDTTEAVSFVKFDVKALAGKSISSAVFSTRSDMNDGKSMTVALKGSKSTAFTRETLTWKTKPGTGDELATVIMDQESGRKEYTPNGTKLIDYINSKIAAMEDEIAFALTYKEGDGGDFKWAGGAGNGTWGPQLVLKIEPPYSIDTITVIEDAYVLEAIPDSTGNGVADMQIGRDDANNADKISYLKFPLIDQETPVGQVTLAIKGALKDTNPDALEKITVQIIGVSNNWKEDTLDWNNKPAEESEILATYDISGSAIHNLTGDALTHYVNKVIKSGATAVSFAVKGKDNTGLNRAWISSKEWVPAQMILDYTVAPPAQQNNVIEDSYVSQVTEEQNSNYGAEADQHLINDDVNQSSKWIYLKYDISEAYANPVSATLKVYGSIHNTSTGIDNFKFRIYDAKNNTWSEDSITWNNKPGVNNTVLLEGNLVNGGKWYELGSSQFSDYIINAIKEGKKEITLVAKGADATPGNRAWIAGKEWRGSSLIINYEPQVEAPQFIPSAGEYISEVTVEMRINTPNATIYYTTDGTEPTDASTMYTAPVVLTESTTLKAIGYANELKPSLVTTVNYIIHPVGVPEFFPSPLVTYTDDNPPVVKILVQPEDAIIYYSDDNSDPSTPYPFGGIPISTTTTIRAQAWSADGSYSSEIVEATYVVEATVEGIGVGPGGVGYPDNSISGQPENTLWLKADEIEEIEDGGLVKTWHDKSGNENHATDIYAGTTPANYHKKIEDAPVYLVNGINNMPAVKFGPIAGREPAIGALAIPDVNNDKEGFDGMGGLSLWVVLKRNTVTSDFTGIVEKRNFYQGPDENGWILQYNGGGGPDEFNFEMRKEDRLVTNGQAIKDLEKAYVIGVDLRPFEKVTFWKNGSLGATMNYNKPINDVEAPLVIGNALRDNVAEIVFFKNGLNEAQKAIVQNYLAGKYSIQFEGEQVLFDQIYTNEAYAGDIIGVGKEMYNTKVEGHLSSSGGALQLEAIGSTFDAGEYVFAGHNKAAHSDNNPSKTWARRWFIQTSENATVDVNLGFNFAEAGLITPATAEGYNVYYSADGLSYSALDAAGTITGDVMAFNLPNLSTGFYALSIDDVSSATILDINNLVNLYPNPATDEAKLVINNAVSGDFRVNINTLTGSTVRSFVSYKPAGPFTENIEISELTPGIYFVEMIQGNQRAVKRLIKK